MVLVFYNGLGLGLFEQNTIFSKARELRHITHVPAVALETAQTGLEVKLLFQALALIHSLPTFHRRFLLRQSPEETVQILTQPPHV